MLYQPPHFAVAERNLALALVRRHPLATLISADGGGEPFVSHVPLVAEADGERLVLHGHVAKPNPQWKRWNDRAAVLAVFHGPDAYISPFCYETAQAVPTWNYAVVHAHGPGRAIEDPLWLLDHLSTMTDVQEARQARPWKVADAPAEYIERMMQAIVGIEIDITSLRGSWKVSQNRAQVDRLGVAAGLRSRDDEASRQMAALVMERAG